MVSDLIFDVGMNNGDDTAYYLYKGFRVVAIEADPTLIDRARERFADAVRDGRLELVNAAIGPDEGIAKFWICESRSEWNSFDRGIASREGRAHHAIDVHCRRFGSLLEQYGTPFYLKIDIEGHDLYCVQGLDPADLPEYISLEMGPLEALFTLRDLGYTGFKLITQNDHSQLAIDVFSVKELVKRTLRPHSAMYALGRRMTPRQPIPDDGPSARNGWEFQLGSSGPFGEDTDGSWHTLDHVAYTWVTYQLGHSHYGAPGLDVWHDVHARHHTPPLQGGSRR
jgi:FkbM family methyltransferase